MVGSSSLQSAFDTLLRGRVGLVVGTGGEAGALLDAALDEADPALFAAHIAPDAVRPGHPAEGKRPTGSDAALFLCDAFRCLPGIASMEEAAEALVASRPGLT